MLQSVTEMSFNESHIEEAALEWLSELGYAIGHGAGHGSGGDPIPLLDCSL